MRSRNQVSLHLNTILRNHLYASIEWEDEKWTENE